MALPRRFLLVWAGQTVSELTGAVSWFGLGLWVWQASGSSAFFSAIMIAGLAPGLFIAPLIAPRLDRWGPRRTMVSSTLGLAALGCAILALLVTDELTVPIAVGLVAAEDVLESAHSLGMASFVATLDDRDLDRANSLLALIDPVVAIAGPAAGGALFALSGLAPLVALDVAGYLLAACTVAYVGGSPKAEPSRSAPRHDSQPRIGWRSAARQGWRFIARRPVLLRLTVVYSTLNAGLGAASVLILPTLMLKSGGDVGLVGSLQAIGGAAGVVGGLAATWLVPRQPPLRVIYGGMVASLLLGPTLTALGRVPLVWAVGAWFAAFFYPSVGAAYQSLWLREVPEGMVSQVLSLRRLLTMVAGPVGMVLAPLLAAGPARVAVDASPLVREVLGAGDTGGHSLTLALSALVASLVVVGGGLGIGGRRRTGDAQVPPLA